MEIVIKIEDYDREWTANGYYIPDEINEKIAEAIIDGTPLPKGHGDLIDRNALITELETDYHNSLSESGAHLFVEITNYIDEAETIIGADKENGNG